MVYINIILGCFNYKYFIYFVKIEIQLETEILYMSLTLKYEANSIKS